MKLLLLALSSLAFNSKWLSSPQEAFFVDAV